MPRLTFVLIAFLCSVWGALLLPAYAQITPITPLVRPPMNPASPFTDTPLCLTLKNSAGREVLVHVETDKFYDDKGNLSWHESNTRLNPDESKNVCTTGPFFPNYQVRVVLRTAVPVYSCLADLDRTVDITMGKDKDGSDIPIADCPSSATATP